MDGPNNKKTRLIPIVGSGGVGKTTLSAAIALHLAQQGNQVALITIDPALRLANALGLDALDGVLRRLPFELKEGSVWAMMLDKYQTSHRLVTRFTDSPKEAQLIFENPYYKAFSRSLAGVQEYMAIHEVNEALVSNRFDFVVLDTPPAQHALDFIDTPQRIHEALNHPTIKRLLFSTHSTSSPSKPSLSLPSSMALKVLGTLTGGSFLRDLTQFLGIFYTVLQGMSESGQALQKVLISPRCRYWIVSTAEDEPLNLAWSMHSALLNRSAHIGGFLINRISPLSTHSLSTNELDQALLDWETSFNGNRDDELRNQQTNPSIKHLNVEDRVKIRSWLQSRGTQYKQSSTHPLLIQDQYAHHQLPQVSPHQDALQTLYALSALLPQDALNF